jgi:hypothetical protein
VRNVVSQLLPVGSRPSTSLAPTRRDPKVSRKTYRVVHITHNIRDYLFHEYSDHDMTPPSTRFKRIARDLEKLPCELHEGVLAELEFGQLIRVSISAGPRLQWSLENSPALWSKYFRDEQVVSTSIV